MPWWQSYRHQNGMWNPIWVLKIILLYWCHSASWIDTQRLQQDINCSILIKLSFIYTMESRLSGLSKIFSLILLFFIGQGQILCSWFFVCLEMPLLLLLRIILSFQNYLIFLITSVNLSNFPQTKCRPVQMSHLVPLSDANQRKQRSFGQSLKNWQDVKNLSHLIKQQLSKK